MGRLGNFVTIFVLLLHTVCEIERLIDRDRDKETRRRGSATTVVTAPFVVRVGIAPFAEYAGFVVYATLFRLLFIHVLVVNDVLGPPNRGRRWPRRVQCGVARGVARGVDRGVVHGGCCVSNRHRFARPEAGWSLFSRLMIVRDDEGRGCGLVRGSLGHGRRSASLVSGGICDPYEMGGRTGSVPERVRDRQRAKTVEREKQTSKN